MAPRKDLKKTVVPVPLWTLKDEMEFLGFGDINVKYPHELILDLQVAVVHGGLDLFFKERGLTDEQCKAVVEAYEQSKAVVE